MAEEELMLPGVGGDALGQQDAGGVQGQGEERGGVHGTIVREGREVGPGVDAVPAKLPVFKLQLALNGVCPKTPPENQLLRQG